MRSDIGVLILTYKRPDVVPTLETLERCGYTGKTYLVIDDLDPTLPKYIENFGEDMIVTFSRAEAAKHFDVGDNLPSDRGVIYARNMCHKIAADLGFDYFFELDDDYQGFYHRLDGQGKYVSTPLRCLDELLSEVCDYLKATPFACIALSQGGDHLGGATSNGHLTQVGTTRKAMNTFICKTDRPFAFNGRINEDVTAYTQLQRPGLPFLTLMAAQVNQPPTQVTPGGMTELYTDDGTYLKSFYSVMYAPSCVSINDFGSKHRRIHHRVSWKACAPQFVQEQYKKEK